MPVVNKLGCLLSHYFLTLEMPPGNVEYTLNLLLLNMTLKKPGIRVLRLQLCTSGGHQIMLSVCLCQTHLTTWSTSISSQVVV